MQMQSSYLLPEPEVLGEGIDNQLSAVRRRGARVWEGEINVGALFSKKLKACLNGTTAVL